MQITAAVAREQGQPFVLEQLELDDPGPGEVRVAVHAVGVCHTDIAIREQWMPVPLPIVLGHEGAGVVESVGAGVSAVVPGDRVVMTFGSCGSCPTCADGHPAYCFELAARNVSGGRPDGTNALHGEGDVHGFFFSQSSFATHAMATERNVVKLDDDVDLSIVGPLGCGIQTGAGAVLNVLQPPEGSSIAVFGVGAVGLAAVMAAKVQGCATIVAVDVKPERLAQALELGATHAIDATAVDDVVAEVQRITAIGAGFSVDTSAVPAAARQAVECLAPLGTCAILGMGPGGTELAVDMTTLLMSGRRIVGVTEGDADPQEFIPRLIALHREGRFPYDRLIRTYPFAEINQACDDAESGAATKAVLLLA
ncbi:NAD(P)-dependent alcohol dehydrogenase [Patulibacter sp. NPDC049589]|uniref:NAD(P)-dependent alcohol dehydrogenase n=1 Tax=Patulibacter sp. NPDC049589 TaxID=3154731 RepID=UPI00342DAFC1